MKIGFYPGCSLKGSSREYSESIYALASFLGMELEEIPDWNCCGSTAAHNLDHELSLALPARIMAIAESHGMNEILVPCAACYSRLSVTRHELLENEELRNRIAETLGQPYTGRTKIINLVEFIQRIPAEKWQEGVKFPFARKVACYYGCLLVRPHNVVQFDRPEDPQSLDQIMKKIGATPLDWAYKVECCGAGFTVSRTDTVSRLSGKILDDAVDRGAEAIIVVCPMCHSNLDMRRDKIEAYQKKKYHIPILYLSQAVGMAMGIPDEKLGLHRHKVPVQIHLDRTSNPDQTPKEN